MKRVIEGKRMKITYLGHAGFIVETNSTLIVMDPWLSEYGAFDSAWFQYPRNHHMAQYVRDLFNTTDKKKYIYISHEHKDHFDQQFLESLENRDFVLILAKFHHPIVKNNLLNAQYHCKEIIELEDRERLDFQDGSSLTMFSIDAELECDSAVLVKTKSKTFLNLNDCKLHERLPEITQDYGPINVFAAQFSGAIWHPTCYDYDLTTYEKIAAHKKTIKFELTARAIETLKPDFYIPSAGPACFLDPMLIDKNFEPINIFPRAPELIQFLDSRCENANTKWPEIMPGDILDVEKQEFVYLSPKRVHEKNFPEYIYSYAKDYDSYFKERAIENNKIAPQEVFTNLKQELDAKIKDIKLVNEVVTTPLYWKVANHKKMYRVNFKEKSISIVSKISNLSDYYSIETPAWQINKVLKRQINWPDFALTFRVKLSRNPDSYNTLIHSFLTLDAHSLERHCELMKSYVDKHERIIVTYEGKQYSILRYCPHQGGDLAQGWIENGCLVCPRHRWHYKLADKGKCTTNCESIDAICLNENGSQPPK